MKERGSAPVPDRLFDTIGLNELKEIVTQEVLRHLGGLSSAVVKPMANARSGTEAVAGVAVAGTEAVAGEPSVTAAFLLCAPCGHLSELARRMGAVLRSGACNGSGVCNVVLACADAAERLSGYGGSDPPWGSLLVVDPESRAGSVSSALELISSADLVFLASLGMKQAFDLASLADDDPFVRILIHALIAGVPVFTVKGPGLYGIHDAGLDSPAGRGGESKGKGKGSSALFSEAAAILRRLHSLGVGRVGIDELARPLAARMETGCTFTTSLQGLLSEAGVVEARAQGMREIVVDRKTVITPLARDRARELGVVIRKG